MIGGRESTWVNLEGQAMRDYYAAVERHMVQLYGSLSEKDRRCHAAVEAEKIGHGGVQYIAVLFDCDPDTIRHRDEDIDRLPVDEAGSRVRKKGGPKES